MEHGEDIRGSKVLVAIALAAAFIAFVVASMGLELPGLRTGDKGIYSAVDGWEGLRFGMNDGQVREVLDGRGIEYEEDSATGMFPGPEGEPHVCRSFQHFHYELDGWKVNLDLESWSLEEISLAAEGRLSPEEIDRFVRAIEQRLGPPGFQQPVYGLSYAPRATWSDPSSSWTIYIWPDGGKYGLVVRIQGKMPY